MADPGRFSGGISEFLAFISVTHFESRSKGQVDLIESKFDSKFPE